jgi:hypothetical protein
MDKITFHVELLAVLGTYELLEDEELHSGFIRCKLPKGVKAKGPKTNRRKTNADCTRSSLWNLQNFMYFFRLLL